MGTVGLLAFAAACGSQEAAGPGADGSDPSAGDMPATGIALPPEASHVHGAGFDPDTGEVLVATHAGLFTVPGPDGGQESPEPERVGPVIDLMGFSVAEPGRYVASGHPSPGVDMPNPVGLIESRDGGETWEALSLSGESDFHALAASEERVVGFDGALRATGDGSEWTDLDSGVRPVSLAVSDDGGTVLATTQQGPMRSEDGGEGFSPVENAPVLALVDWAAGTDTVYGLTPEGEVHRSEDAGATWERTGRVDGRPQAVHAEEEQVFVVADDHISRSGDGGGTFTGW